MIINAILAVATQGMGVWGQMVVNAALAGTQGWIGRNKSGEGSLDGILLHGLAGCAGAAAKNANCAAGFVAAAGSEFATGQLYGDFKLKQYAVANMLKYGHPLISMLASGGSTEEFDALQGILTSKLRYNECSEEHGGCWTTQEERELVEAGNWDAYYALACQNGDKYACYAREIAKEEGFWAVATTYWLQYRAIKAIGRPLIPNEMNEIRLELANRYANLYYNFPEFAHWPKREDIIHIHWEAFGNKGLPPHTFGGTALGPSSAPLTQSLTNWCPQCID